MRLKGTGKNVQYNTKKAQASVYISFESLKTHCYKYIEISKFQVVVTFCHFDISGVK